MTSISNCSQNYNQYFVIFDHCLQVNKTKNFVEAISSFVYIFCLETELLKTYTDAYIGSL